MATQADLDAALTTLSGGIGSLATSVGTLGDLVNQLIAKLQSNPGGPDLTNEVVALQSLSSSITTDAGNLQAAIDAAKKALGQ